MCSCSSSADTPCAVSWPPSQSVSSSRWTLRPRRAAASAAATPPVPPPTTSTSHSTSRDGARAGNADDRDAGIARERDAHDVDDGVDAPVVTAARHFAMVPGSHIAICGKAMTSPRATSCRPMYGQIERKMSPSVIPGGVTPFR